ncbi:MAG: hypothetical protein IKI37_01295 [Oscillospiraceae bacterium]|nr:hypothetical protein [Oscillospiraceae bacterium]MBR7083808.1 hypothetical protein [Oscillospiraceae bacterium]
MKFKKKIKFDKNNMTLELGNHKKTISPEDDFIVQALQNHVSDAYLLKLVMKTEQADEIEASFRMASFVEEYGEFLEEEPAGTIPYRRE